jgi:hypothetical protein
VLEQESGEYGSERAASELAGRPDRDGLPALPFVAEHVGDQGKCGRRQGRAGDAQQRTRDDQHQRADREGGHDRQHRERRSADHQQPSAADPVAERTHHDDQAGHHESVAVTDPQLLDVGGTQAGAQPWEREEQRRHVHRDEQCRQHEDVPSQCGVSWARRALRKSPSPSVPHRAITARSAYSADHASSP